MQEGGVHGWKHDRLLCASSKIRQSMGEVMHFKLEEFIKNNRKPRCARNDNLTVYNTQRNSSKPCTDHLGNRFGSYKEMALFHKVEPEIFYYRKNKAKLPLELCLSPKSLRGHRYAKKYLLQLQG